MSSAGCSSQSSQKVGSNQGVVSLSKGREEERAKKLECWRVIILKDCGIRAGKESNRIPGVKAAIQKVENE